MMTKEISNSENILDTRDILDQIAQLEIDTTEEAAEELATLQALIEEVRQYSGEAPEDGVALIRDSYFEEYAHQLAEDTGAISRGPQFAPWPLSYIDWAAATDALKMDYSEVDFDGVSYWIRS